MKVAVVTFSLLLAAAPARGAEPEGKPTVVPAVLRSIAPMGVVRGGTATFTLDGERLAGATGVFFDDAAITGRVLPAADPKKPDAVRVLALTDKTGRVLAQANAAGSHPEPLLGYRFSTAGTYVIQIRDFETAGGKDVYYRLNVGEFPVVTTVFPHGLRQGASGEVKLSGFNLGAQRSIRVTPPAAPAAWGQTISLPG